MVSVIYGILAAVLAAELMDCAGASLFVQAMAAFCWGSIARLAYHRAIERKKRP